MTHSSAQAPCALPFFMPAKPGERFCLFHRPAPGQPVRGGMLYVHPFAEEMNKTRRMAALQARAFAARGYGVLQIDLYGCGDSSGDFLDARWTIWKQDLALACAWLSHQVSGPISLWGLRLGALLALDFSADAQQSVKHLILWQPVINGRSHMNQFLRMRIASQMLADDGQCDPIGATSATLRAQLATGAGVEVGGYELASELVAAIDLQDAAARAPHCPTHWFELEARAAADVGAGLGTSAAPATARHAQRWSDAGASMQLHTVCGVPFWASTEIVECTALLAATTALCT